ncbi:hypothetical protein ALP24_02440 [Pseudomonas syringae pv. aptata]|uniref:Uncharacterized protein n=1 Tax=Pseudomonas syringae pv. aptata TaxID=83167 RepID=A0A3M5WCL9_PSEAP|nr:hypothetical protein ALP24_02440 [Pseudomonas syringae pv. aptata]
MLNHYFEMAGRAMGRNDHVDWELDDAINDLIDEGLLEAGTPAYGVAQQVIHSGIESLSSDNGGFGTSTFGNHWGGDRKS